MSSSALQKMLSSAISHLHNDVRFVGAGYYEELRGKELQDNSFFKIALIYESAQMDSVLSDSEHIISTLDHLVTAFSDESAPGTARWT